MPCQTQASTFSSHANFGPPNPNYVENQLHVGVGTNCLRTNWPNSQDGIGLGFTYIFFHLEKGTYSGLGLRLSCSVKSFQTKIGCGEQSWHLKELRRDALWDPAIHHSHTPHCHEDTLDNTTTPCPQ